MNIENSSYGTLSDKDIEKLCFEKKLIVDNFLLENIKQACYELRASNTYWDLSESDPHKQRKIIKDNEYILIKPRQMIVVITHEKLDLPKNILGRVLTKGSWFSLGIIPVNTYADPGFYGKLGIVLNNLSNDYIKINMYDSIAKIEFSKLSIPVCREYKGQHGYESEIWPVKRQNILSEEERNNDGRIKEFFEELEITHGKDISNIMKRVFKYERRMIFACIAYLTFTIILIGIILSSENSNLKEVVNPIISIILGVISNIIFGICSFLATNIKRKVK